jgi:hypothetical protein
MDSSSDVLEGASPTPSPRPPGRGLFFRQPAEETPPPPRSSPESPLVGETGRTAEQLPADDGSASATGWPSDEPLDESDPDPTSSKASSGSPAKAFSKAATKAAIAKGVLVGSAVVHRVAARTEGQQAVGLYLADADDAENIADPLAAIAGRREGIAGKVSPDTADAVRAMMGLANYMSKQIAATIAAREIDAGRPPAEAADV